MSPWGLFCCMFFYFLKTVQYFLMKFCTDNFSITLTVTTLNKYFLGRFFLSVGGHFGVFWHLFGIFLGPFWKILIIFCTDVLILTMIVTTYFLHYFHLFWGPFLHIFEPNFICDLLFLQNRSMFFHEFSYKFLKTLWLLFMDEAQLSQGHKPLRADSLLFTNKFPEGLGITLYYSDGLSITWMVLLLLWQSLHTQKNCSLNPPSQVSAIIIKLLYVKTYVCQNFGVRDVCGQIPKSIYKRRHTFYLVIFLTISR